MDAFEVIVCNALPWLIVISLLTILIIKCFVNHSLSHCKGTHQLLLNKGHPNNVHRLTIQCLLTIYKELETSVATLRNLSIS